MIAKSIPDTPYCSSSASTIDGGGIRADIFASSRRYLAHHERSFYFLAKDFIMGFFVYLTAGYLHMGADLE